jgi:hypothetical protein
VNQDHVDLLEDELEIAIAKVLRRLAQEKQIDMTPPKRTCHLMAKAAVAVLEAVDQGPT